jgi:MarR family transcriptional regulator, temperature-dependent positive regulator of motility
MPNITRRAADPSAPAPPPSREPIAGVHRVPAYLARRLHQICLGMMAEVTEPAGLTVLEYSALGSIDDRPGIDQRRLAERMGIDKDTAGDLVDALEARGLLGRRIDPADRRARALHLTPEGLALRRRVRPAALAAQERILAPLGPADRQTLVALLVQVVEGNAAYARPGNGRRKPRRDPRAPPPPQE